MSEQQEKYMKEPYDIVKYINENTGLTMFENNNQKAYLLGFLESVETHINKGLPFKTNLFDEVKQDIQRSINER